MNRGSIVKVPSAGFICEDDDEAITSNTCSYEATGGYNFAGGQAAKRFAVRNTSAESMVEGLSDHASAYMTGGIVVCFERAGRNVGVGITGGHAH